MWRRSEVERERSASSEGEVGELRDVEMQRADVLPAPEVRAPYAVHERKVPAVFCPDEFAERGAHARVAALGPGLAVYLAVVLAVGPRPRVSNVLLVARAHDVAPKRAPGVHGEVVPQAEIDLLPLRMLGAEPAERPILAPARERMRLSHHPETVRLALPGDPSRMSHGIGLVVRVVDLAHARRRLVERGYESHALKAREPEGRGRGHPRADLRACHDAALVEGVVANALDAVRNHHAR